MKFTNFENAVSWAVKDMTAMNGTDGCGWIAEDYLPVLKDFFEAYNLFEGKEHPEISYPEMVQLMERMPWADTGEKVPLDPGEYVGLIGAYFCDTCPERERTISDFFSGDTRLRLYFTMRGVS